MQGGIQSSNIRMSMNFILLKKGVYAVSGSLRITDSGIILRGEGDHEDGTVVIASGKGKRNLIQITGDGNRREIPGTRTPITGSYVPVGTCSFSVENGSKFKVGDHIVVFRPGTERWIKDLKMDQAMAGPARIRCSGIVKQNQWPFRTPGFLPKTGASDLPVKILEILLAKDYILDFETRKGKIYTLNPLWKILNYFFILFKSNF